MKANPYESRRYLDEYLLFHFGTARQLCAFDFVSVEFCRFHERIRKECLLPLRRSSRTRALDIGCGVGRFAFELAVVAGSAHGIDNSVAFIKAAKSMALRRRLEVRVPGVARSSSKCEVRLPRSLQRGKVTFAVADAQQLAREPAPAEIAGYDIVAGINLLCRLPRPRQFLANVHRLVVPGGQLLLASPFSWLEEFTPADEWVQPQEVLALLKPHFILRRRRDLPFLIREHQRKYQLGVSEILTFERRTT